MYFLDDIFRSYTGGSIKTVPLELSVGQKFGLVWQSIGAVTT